MEMTINRPTPSLTAALARAARTRRAPAVLAQRSARPSGPSERMR